MVKNDFQRKWQIATGKYKLYKLLWISEKSFQICNLIDVNEKRNVLNWLRFNKKLHQQHVKCFNTKSQVIVVLTSNE